MRKNKMMRTAAVLGVAAMLTASVLSGTFAKYTTSTAGSDKARVAYWGFKKDAELNIDLFDAEYKNGDAVTVKSTDGTTNVVAPGTAKTSEFAFNYTGYSNNGTSITAPEVAYTFKVDAAVTGSYANLDANPDFKWTLKKDKNGTESEYNTIDELVAAIKKLSGDDSGTKVYEAGALPSEFTSVDTDTNTITNTTYTVGWKWAFEDTGKTAAQDENDTKMGNGFALTPTPEAAAALDNVDLTITITATQKD